MNYLRRLLRGSLGAEHYVFGGILILRLFALAQLTDSPSFLPHTGDTHFYDEWARRIAAGQWTDHHAFYGLPLYAYWLALIYKVFGYSPFLPALVQVVADAGSGVLIFKLGERLFGTNGRQGLLIGSTAATAWAFYIPAQAYSVILMPTALVVFVFWLLVWQLVKRDTMPTHRSWFVCGFLVGFTAMAVATILFVLPLLLAAAVLRWPRPGRLFPLQLALVPLLLLAGVAVGASPCWLHNRLVAHDHVFLSAHSGINFWIGNNPSATGYPTFSEVRAGQAEMLQDSIAYAEHASGHSLSRGEVSAFWSAKTTRAIAQHPVRWLKLLLQKLRNFWSAFQYDDLSIIDHLSAQRVILPGLRFGLVAAFALPGLVLLTRRTPQAGWIVAAVALQMLALLPVFVTERYRLAAVPGLILFAAGGASFLWNAVAQWRWRDGSRYLTILIGAVAFVSWPQLDPALAALGPYHAGLRLLEAGKLGAAEQQLLLSRAYIPANTEVNLALGNVALEKKDYGVAERYYLATLRLNSSHPAALSNLGLCFLEQGDSRRAASYIRSALRVQPEDAKTHYLLARALLEGGEVAEASSQIANALRLEPDRQEFRELRQQIDAASVRKD